MQDVVRIALLITWDLAYCRGVLRGVREYAQGRPGWVLTPLDPAADIRETFPRLKPNGILAHAYDKRLAASLRRLRTPVVNVGGVLMDAGLPRVGIDDYAVGQLAAQHLLERGLRHFAFVGHRAHAYSVRRESGFRDALQSKGFSVASHQQTVRGGQFYSQGRPWALDAEVKRWLIALPKPAGVFACNDIWGVQLGEACRQTGLRVPDDVAILGVDDDDLLCELARPSLSSVAVPAERIGFEAAQLLDRLIQNGKKRQHQAKLLPPLGVITRQSTDLVATDDADVSAALRFIRTSDGQLRVADVLAKVPVSRRSLERRFRKLLGRGIWEEIRQTRVDRAKLLLSETSLPMPLIARRAGFTSAKQLSLVFRQQLKTTPTTYRRDLGSGS